MVTPNYSTLSQADMNLLTEMVARAGYSPIVAALGDILTQSSTKDVELALLLGQTTAIAYKADKRR